MSLLLLDPLTCNNGWWWVGPCIRREMSSDDDGEERRCRSNKTQILDSNLHEYTLRTKLCSIFAVDCWKLRLSTWFSQTLCNMMGRCAINSATRACELRNPYVQNLAHPLTQTAAIRRYSHISIHVTADTSRTDEFYCANVAKSSSWAWIRTDPLSSIILSDSKSSVTGKRRGRDMAIRVKGHNRIPSESTRDSRPCANQLQWMGVCCRRTFERIKLILQSGFNFRNSLREQKTRSCMWVLPTVTSGCI